MRAVSSFGIPMMIIYTTKVPVSVANEMVKLLFFGDGETEKRLSTSVDNG